MNLENDCISHVRVCRNVVFTERDYQCRICKSPELKECYDSAKNYGELNLNHGREAMELMRTG